MDSYVIKAKTATGVGAGATGVTYVGAGSHHTSAFNPALSAPPPLADRGVPAGANRPSTYNINVDHVTGLGPATHGVVHVDASGRVLDPQAREEDEAVLDPAQQRNQGDYT